MNGRLSEDILVHWLVPFLRDFSPLSKVYDARNKFGCWVCSQDPVEEPPNEQAQIEVSAWPQLSVGYTKGGACISVPVYR